MIITTDPIADMLTRIRNSLAINRANVDIPYSKLKEILAAELKKQGFIDDLSVAGEGKEKMITLTLFAAGESGRITKIERVSKPGRRLYAKSTQIPTIKNGRGIVVVSTSKGVMSGTEAKSQNLGGELICKVY